MKVVTINGNGGSDPYDVMVHKFGCADVKKAITRGNFPHDYFVEETESKRDLWLNYNSDFIAEESGAWDIHFYACTAGLPDGGKYNITSEEENADNPPE